MGQSQSTQEQTVNDRSTANQGHAFNHAPAALRIFRFAADSAPRVLELAHVSAFLRECAVEFGSADAALPVALRIEYASGRFFKLRLFAKCFEARCLWLVAKVLACRSVAPVPAAALAPDVTRHDVDWGAEGVRYRAGTNCTRSSFALSCKYNFADSWAQGAVGVSSGKHFFQVCVTDCYGRVRIGWADDKLALAAENDWVWVGRSGTLSAGAAYDTRGCYFFGTGPLAADSYSIAPDNVRQCVIGALLDLDATPARMTVFVDGEPLAVQCEYAFPKDERAWFPSVYLDGSNLLHSCAM
jgi:hypothetical protein